MGWTREDIIYLAKHYPKRVHIDEICLFLKKSRRAVRHKAARLGISRKGILVRKLGDSTPRNIIDRRYYLNHRIRIYQRKMQRRWKIKQKMADLMGGKCSLCGYKKCISALEFHHKSKDKEFSIGELIKNSSEQNVLKEVQRCILVCANCHRELHARGSVV